MRVHWLEISAIISSRENLEIIHKSAFGSTFNLQLSSPWTPIQNTQKTMEIGSKMKETPLLASHNKHVDPIKSKMSRDTPSDEGIRVKTNMNAIFQAVFDAPVAKSEMLSLDSEESKIVNSVLGTQTPGSVGEAVGGGVDTQD
jgi:hypothetical protein